MLFTGRVVTAGEALEWGLIARVTTPERLMAEATDALEWCCRCAPSAFTEVKRAINDVYGTYDRMTMDKSIRGPEALEGWQAFRDRRNPTWVPDDLRLEGRL